MLPVFIQVQETVMKRISLIAVLAGLTFGAGNALAAADGAKLVEATTGVRVRAKTPPTP